MILVNENQFPYRFEVSGPKYLLRGPNIDFGLVRLMPGEDFSNHLHERIEENFYVLEGEIDILVNDRLNTIRPGDLIHVEPTETHYLKNNGKVPATAVFVKAPYDPKDKVDVALKNK